MPTTVESRALVVVRLVAGVLSRELDRAFDNRVQFFFFDRQANEIASAGSQTVKNQVG